MERFNSILFHKSRPAKKQHTNQSILEVSLIYSGYRDQFVTQYIKCYKLSKRYYKVYLLNFPYFSNDYY